jgi:hypothetical protein
MDHRSTIIEFLDMVLNKGYQIDGFVRQSSDLLKQGLGTKAAQDANKENRFPTTSLSFSLQ